MATINELLQQMGIDTNDLEKTASSAVQSENPVADFLTKVAEEMGAMSEDEEIDMIIQALKDLKQRKMSGEQLSPEEEQFMSEAEPMLAQMGKFAGIKTAGGQADIVANYQEQEGLMAEGLRSSGPVQRITNLPRNAKGDERGGEDNPAAIGNRQGYDNGPASKTSENSGTVALTGEKSAMAKVAQQAVYNKTVDAYGDYIIEKLASAGYVIAPGMAVKEASQREKIAEVNKLAAASELEGRLMARAFVDELNKLASQR